MNPSYSRINKFDTTYTKYAKKYSLHLYREEGKDKLLLKGLPILFIPGNAGSYRQVRSIAAETADLYKSLNGQYNSSYDFFTADFNEDFTAFHGRTMLDQAEYLNEAINYIQSLYDFKQKVILLGHSMGGVVARVMLSLPNHPKNSVDTIITLASPHSAPPVTFDGDVLKLYSSTDRFWYNGYNNEGNNSLQNVLIVSITGGAIDDILPADYTTLGFLVPPSNGFTVFSTGIPEVWTAIDHLAIVWCGQLRYKLAKTLLEIQNLNLIERMKVFKRQLLSGFEREKNYEKLSKPFDLDFNDSSIHKSVYHIFPNSTFSALSSLPFTVYDELINSRYINPSLLLCKDEKKCVDFNINQINVPNAKIGMKLEESSYGGHHPTFYAFNIRYDDINGFNTVVILDRLNSKSEIIIGDISPDKSYELEGDLLKLNLLGSKIVIPNKPLLTNIHIPGAWSSLLSYRLKMNHTNTESLFSPFIRQWSDEPFETKWHVNIENELSLTMHGIAPYVPFKASRTHGMNVEIWSDSIEPLEVKLSVDWLSSGRLLIIRYRLGLVASCVMIMLFILSHQIKVHQKTNKIPSILQSLQVISSFKNFFLICFLLSIITPIVKIELVQSFLDMIDPVVLKDSNEINLTLNREFKLNSFYLGLEENFLFIIGPILFAIGIGLIYTSYYVIMVIGSLISYGFKKVNKTVELDPNDNTQWKWKRYLLGGIVVIATTLVLPYQLLFIICCLVQTIKIIRTLTNVNVKDVEQNNLLNYQLTFLLLMLWILPIHIPILIVFVHNLAVNWKIPFSSHHNILSILPIILLIERNSSMKVFNFNKKSILNKGIWGYCQYFIFYCVIYGIRHTFWLHHLFNFLCCLILLNLYDDEVAEVKEESRANEEVELQTIK